MRFIVTIICVLLVPLASAQNLVEFENGQVADADDINANFQALQQELTLLKQRLSLLEPGNGCLSLSNVGDGVLLGTSENLFNLAASTSISAWLRLSEDSSCQSRRCPILSLEQTNSGVDSLNAGISLFVGWEQNEARLVYFASDGRGGGNPSAMATPTLSKGVWHHLAAVRDGNSVQIYVDGELTVSYDDDPVGSIEFNGGAWDHSNTWIGKDFANGLDNTSVQGLFDGELARVGIWTSALSSTNIKAMYEGGFDYAASNPAGYWPLDERNGLVARDLSTFGNDGYLEGEAAWVEDCF